MMIMMKMMKLMMLLGIMLLKRGKEGKMLVKASISQEAVLELYYLLRMRLILLSALKAQPMEKNRNNLKTVENKNCKKLYYSLKRLT